MAVVGKIASRGLHGGLMVAVFVAVVGLVNVLAARHNIRWDLSETGQFSLAPQTIKVLESLDRDVTVTLFVQDLTQVKSTLEGLVESYQYHTSRLSSVWVDPEKQPVVANRYGITQYNTVVFESGGQETRVRLLAREDLVNREQLFTNALIRVTRTEKKQIAFLEGHGEHRIEDDGQGGYALLKDALVKEGYDTISFSLAQQGAVPAGTTAIVIGGPTRLFPRQEVQALLDYLNGGGRLLVMVDPLVQSGLEPLLQAWGLTLDQDLVIEKSVTLFGAGAEMAVVTTYSTSHAITKDFTLSTAFPLARSLRFDPAKSNKFLFEGLAKTSERSWGETDLESGQVSLDKLRDLKGPLTIAAAMSPFIKDDAETPLPPSDAAADPSRPASTARMVVFGDSDFSRNDSFRLMGNGDLALNTINWLAEEEETIAIRPKEASTSPLILSGAQEQTLFLVAVVILPGASLLIGLGAWLWRRRL